MTEQGETEANSEAGFSDLDRALRDAESPLTPELGEDAAELIQRRAGEAADDLFKILSSGRLDRALETAYSPDTIDAAKESLRDALIGIGHAERYRKAGNPLPLRGVREPQQGEK